LNSILLHVYVVFKNYIGTIEVLVLVVGNIVNDRYMRIPACDPGTAEDQVLGKNRIEVQNPIVLYSTSGWTIRHEIENIRRGRPDCVTPKVDWCRGKGQLINVTWPREFDSTRWRMAG